MYALHAPHGKHRICPFKARASQATHLVRPLHEPVDGAAVDDRGEHTEPRPEGFSQRRHTQHDVNVGPDAVDVLSSRQHS